jgi:four helix bundle protein
MPFLRGIALQNLRRSARTSSKPPAFSSDSAGPSICLSGVMTPDEMKGRTKTFSVAVVKFARSLPNDIATTHMARQLVKSGTSVGANYRSSCRAKSTADFISKMTTVEEEADETLFWLEILVDTNTVATKAVCGADRRSRTDSANRCRVDQDLARQEPLRPSCTIRNPQSAIKTSS